jgi:DNA-binding response OmpR family regulator
MARKILVVEDNRDTVAMMKLSLEKAGYIVDTAFNGEEGYRKAQDFLPDIILLDIMMPIMDGFTMNQHLKNNVKTQKIPVIVVSARSGMAPLFDSDKGPQIQGYLVKPVSRNILLMKIEELFRGATP